MLFFICLRLLFAATFFTETPFCYFSALGSTITFTHADSSFMAFVLMIVENICLSKHRGVFKPNPDIVLFPYH